MSPININRNVTDPYYRYKMPNLIAKPEGRGNGVKTVVPNMSDIARALRVPPAYPTKYLGIELGAQVIMDDKTNRYIVNGSHSTEKLQSLIYEYIETYLLCPSCGNPETYMETRGKRDKIVLTCKACGNQNVINTVHRLNAFIIKNPPPKESKVDEPVVNTNNNMIEIEPFFSQPDEKDSQFMTDMSAEAVKQRSEEISGKLASIMIQPNSQQSLRERIENFITFTKEKLEHYTKQSVRSIVAKSKEIGNESKAILALCQASFANDHTAEVITQYKCLFEEFCSTSSAQLNFINSIEILIADKMIEQGQILKVFKLIYDYDIVCEEVFFKWRRQPPNKFILPALHKSVLDITHPFFYWLENAECESDDEDDESSAQDEEEEKEEKRSAETHKNGIHVQSPMEPIQSALKYEPIKIESDLDDLNIDDI